MKESLSVRLLYETIPGRMVLKLLVNPKVSKAAGVLLDSGISKSLIKGFKKSNNISLKDVIIPQGGFKSFNDFFARKRNIKLEISKGELISPCDAFLTCIPIKKNTIYDIKHTRFTLEELLKDKKLAKEFEGGYALVYRLTPAHYHRYCHCVNGMATKHKTIKGILHCVRPIVTSKIPVFVQNSREYQVYSTDEFGKVIQMEVGALLVGRITNNKLTAGQMVAAGTEKGYFEYGGSTIVVLLQNGKILLDDKIIKANKGEEISVSYGERIGICR